MQIANSASQWMTIRVGHNALSFAMPDEKGDVHFSPYEVKSSVSVAANLREAFKTNTLLQSAGERVRVLVDSPVLVVPVELFDKKDIEPSYHYTYPGLSQEIVTYNVLPDLNAVAVFSIGKDLRLVIDDHFREVRLISAMSPVWRYLHERSFATTRQKLYGYFHEQRVEVFAYQQNRFRFCNSFDARHAHDALYFLLYVWKQLQLRQQDDELYLVGDLPDQDSLLTELKKYVKRTYLINPSVDFYRAQVTKIEGMPFDLQTLFVKGR